MRKTRNFMSSIFISLFTLISPNFVFSENINSDVEILLDKLSKSSKNEAKQIRNEIWNVWRKPRELDDQAFARDRCLSFANEWISFFYENASEEIQRRKSMKLKHREQ